jgi:hypothetical protein
MNLRYIVKRLSLAFIAKAGSEIRIRYWRRQGMKIGNKCQINNVNFSTEPYLIEIGDHVAIAAGTDFITHDGAIWCFRDELKNADVFGTIKIGNNVFIGFASDAGGMMEYIAPQGKTVLFKENPKSFTDISGHWAKSYIDFVTERELFLGTGSNTFSPETGMTRAMFATVIGRLYERSYGKLAMTDIGSKFSDSDHTTYYGSYVDWAAENNIVTGVGSGKFEPDRKITREEMAVMLYRFAEFLKISATASGESQLSYPDASAISAWATDAAVYCQQTGIISGRDSGNFVPWGTATRAEVAAILQRFIENTVK